MPDHRLPFQPVFEIMRVRHGTPTVQEFPARELSADLWSNKNAAIQLGVTEHLIARWLRYGMTHREADRVCTELCLFGEQVWGEAWWTVEDRSPRGARYKQGRVA